MNRRTFLQRIAGTLGSIALLGPLASLPPSEDEEDDGGWAKHFMQAPALTTEELEKIHEDFYAALCKGPGGIPPSLLGIVEPNATEHRISKS